MSEKVEEPQGDKYKREVHEKTLEILPILNQLPMCQIEDILSNVLLFVKMKPIII